MAERAVAERAALAGLRVVELAHAMAGELAGMVLADYGAEVVKVERPGRVRDGTGPTVWNRGKRSVTADLETPGGRAAFERLVSEADAVLTDVKPATLGRLGATALHVARCNPDAVHVSITGFGTRGPLADLPGHEYVVSAKSGRMAAQAAVSGRPPAFTPAPVASFGAAMLAVAGVLAGIRHRDRTGHAPSASTSLLHALVTLDMTSGHGHRIHTPDTSGKVYGVMPLAFMTARCKDGQYLQMCSRVPRLFRNWIRVLGLEHLYDDPAYQQMPDAFPSQQALDDVIATVRQRMAARTRDEWLAIFGANDVGANPFLTPPEFLTSEQALVTGSVAEVDDPVHGRLRQVGPLVGLSDTPGGPQASAPAPGADGDAAAGRYPAWASHRRPRPSGAGPLLHPLADLLVVEGATAYATPQAATLLAEMGARVIKVEPPEGDHGRRNWTTTYTKESVGKESVVLDLKTADGQAILHDLIRRADVYTHNFRPGVPARLGADYETLSAVNPQLVYVYGSCYGSVGPWSHLPGFHSSPNAISGTGWLEAGDGNPPQNRTFGDPTGALGLTAGILVALAARDRTGRGQYVEGTMLRSLAYAVSHYSVTGIGVGSTLERPPVPTGAQRGLGPFCRLYDTSQGTLLVCAVTARERSALREAAARLGTEVHPDAKDDDVAAALAAMLAVRPAGEWEADLLAAGVPAVRADDPVLFDFMLRSDQMRALGLSVEDEIEDVGRFWRSAGSVDFAEMPNRTRSSEPLGASTERVLRELGRDDAEIGRISGAGVTRPVGQGL